MISSLLEYTIGSYIAPDPVYEEKQRQNAADNDKIAAKITLSDAIGQFVAPDPAYLAKKYEPKTNGKDAVTDITPERVFPSSSTLPADTFSAPTTPLQHVVSPLTGESGSADDGIDEELQKRVKSLVLDSCHGTAESLTASTKDWEVKKNFFTLCSSIKEMKDAKKKTMLKMLKKNPKLAVIRSAQLGNMVPDGFSPLHAAAYVGNKQAVEILLDFIKLELDQFSSIIEMKSVAEYLEMRDNQGRTALHVSAERGFVQITELLRIKMEEASGHDPVGEHAPIDLCRRTPLGWALTSKISSATKNRQKLESILFSPGDRSIYPRTPASARCSTSKAKSSAVRRPGINIAYGYSDMPGRRVEMEDTVCIFNEICDKKDMALFGVFDGHGNKEVSAFASEHILNCLEDVAAFRSGAPVKLLKKCLMDACLGLDAKLKTDLFHFSKNGGSTGIIALITPTHVLTANVGDSRAIIIQKDYRQDESTESKKIETKPIVIPMSEDHSPNLPNERARIEAAGFSIESLSYQGETLYKIKDPESGNMLAMSRAFGDFDYKKGEESPSKQAVIAVPDVEILERSENDLYLILACDGIWDVMSNEDCANFIVNDRKRDGYETLSNTCDALVEECYNLGSDDNMTVLIVELPTPIGLGRNLNFTSNE